MVETVRENSNIVHNDSSEHRLENKATHPKSPLDPSDQRALVNKSAGESIENEENLDREYCGQESQHQQHEHKQQHPQSDLSLELNPLNWDELRSKFDSAMQEQAEEEKKVIERFDKLVAVRGTLLPVSCSIFFPFSFLHVQELVMSR